MWGNYFVLCYLSLPEDLGEDPGSCPHYFHLDQTIRVASIDYFHVNFPPTLIGHSSVVAALRQFEMPVIWNVSCPCFC